MLIPIRTDYRLSHRPWTNYVLIVANVVVFLLGYHGMSDLSRLRISSYMLQPDMPQLHQFFSSVFLHGDWMHLIGNMLFLWVFGNAVNDRLGNTGYLAFYLAGGVLGGVGYLLLSPHAAVLGASGAISAVTGAYLVLFPRARVTLLFVFYFITTLEVSSLYFLLFQFVFNLYMSLVQQAGFGGGGVAYVAHSSGYLFGIGIALLLLAVRLIPRDVFDLLNLIGSRRRRSRYRRVVSQGYDPYNYISSRLRQGQSRWIQTSTGETTTADTSSARELALRREISEDLGRHDLSSAAGKYLQLVRIADQVVLPQPQQLDVANQLMAQENHPAAADAYERFVRHYGGYEHIADIYLLLGILYGRYLQQASRAREYLNKAAEGLRDSRKLELARAELRSLHGRS